MEYKLIYRPYNISALTENLKGKEGKYELSNETHAWNKELTAKANEGWKVKNAGALESQSSSNDPAIIFWALLEKE